MPGAQVSVGQDPARDVQLPDERVSLLHASLKLQGTNLLVRDELSSNGTFVDGEPIPPNVWVRVRGGRVAFGPIDFSVQIQGDAGAPDPERSETR